MKVTKISKERLGAYVAFPRTQCKGLTEPLDVRQDEFKIVEVNDVPGMGTAKLIEAVNTPRRVYQLFLPDNEAQFDDYLSKLLGMHESPTYIDGDTSFIIIFQGNHDSVEINQLNYKEVVAAIRKTVSELLGGGICMERNKKSMSNGRTMSLSKACIPAGLEI